MPQRALRSTFGSVSGYAVFWRTGGIAFHGRLDFDSHGLWLHGGEREHELRIEVPYEEIVSVERDPRNRIGPCEAACVHTRAAGNLLIASAGGIGLLTEIVSTLQQALGG